MDWAPRRIGLLRIFGVATLFGLFSALQAYNYVSLFTDRKQPFHVLLALNVTYWYAWAVLVPGILWLARRYRFGRQTWKRAAAMHGLGVLSSTFTHAVLSVSARVVIMQVLAGRSVDWWMSFRELFFLNFDWEMMTYWAVVFFSHALDYQRESRERKLAAAQLETRLAEAQLQSLQRQLHPHFLFNTLHTISALMHRDTDAADAMLVRLSELLRLTLDRGGMQQLPLKAELDFLQKYLDIERARFGDRLQINVDIEPETLDALVPNFLLQPIVENALRHGIGPKIGGGRVEIIARREAADPGVPAAHASGMGWNLRLIVRDNGAGVSTEKMDAFNTGVGLSNTRSRLEHLYGTHQRFEFHTPPGGGLAVTIVVPFASPSETPARRLETVA